MGPEGQKRAGATSTRARATLWELEAWRRNHSKGARNKTGVAWWVRLPGRSWNHRRDTALLDILAKQRGEKHLRASPSQTSISCQELPLAEPNQKAVGEGA